MQSNNNSSINEGRLILDGREVKIAPSSKEEFTKNILKLKCFHCSNFLFSAKTCKSCYATFCSKCVSNSTKCPDNDCASKVFEEIKNDTIKVKLSKILIECAKQCGDDSVSMLNYLEHLDKCQGILF